MDMKYRLELFRMGRVSEIFEYLEKLAVHEEANGRKFNAKADPLFQASSPWGIKGHNNIWFSSGVQFQRGQKVLDVGGGYNPLAQTISDKYGCEVWLADDYGIESNEPLWSRWGIRDELQSKFPDVHYVFERVGDPEKSSLPENYFDVIYSVSVLEHISGDGHKAVFNHMRRLLKPGGRLIHSVDINMISSLEQSKNPEKMLNSATTWFRFLTRNFENQLELADGIGPLNELELGLDSEIICEYPETVFIYYPPSNRSKSYTRRGTLLFSIQSSLPGEEVQQAQVPSIEQPIHWKPNRKHPVVPVKKGFEVKLSPRDVDSFLSYWKNILELDLQKETLDEIERNIQNITPLCVGRLAGDIQDAILRILAAKSIRKEKIQILEIGTLFGVNALLTYLELKRSGQPAKITMIDPLFGYYQPGELDILTKLPVCRENVIANFENFNVPVEDYEILQFCSDDPEVLKIVADRKFDYIFIDGNHSFQGVSRDYTNYYPLINQNGIIVFDNYMDGSYPDIDRFIQKVVFARPDQLQCLGIEWRSVITRKVEDGSRQQVCPDFPCWITHTVDYPKGIRFKFETVDDKKTFDKSCEDGLFLDTFLDELYSNDILLDIGAGFGQYTLPASRYLQQVFLFENNPQLFRNLQENLRINGFENIIPVLNHYAEMNPLDGLSFSPQSNLASPTVIRMDLCTQELAILKELDEILLSPKLPGKIFIEIFGMQLEQIGISVEVFKNILREFGYQCREQSLPNGKIQFIYTLQKEAAKGLLGEHLKNTLTPYKFILKEVPASLKPDIVFPEKLEIGLLFPIKYDRVSNPMKSFYESIQKIGHSVTLLYGEADLVNWTGDILISLDNWTIFTQPNVPGRLKYYWATEDVQSAGNRPLYNTVLAGKVFSVIDGVVVNSQIQRLRWLTGLEIGLDKVIYLPIGIDEGPETFSFKRGHRVYYCFPPERGLDYLLTAWSIIRFGVPDAELFLFRPSGYTQNAGYDRFYQQALQLPGVIDCRQLSDEDQKEIIRSCRALVYPCTVPEMSGTEILTAMRNGAVVVSTMNGAIPEFAWHNPVIPNADDWFDCWMREVITVMTDDAYYASIASANVDNARCFEWQTLLSQWFHQFRADWKVRNG